MQIVGGAFGRRRRSLVAQNVGGASNRFHSGADLATLDCLGKKYQRLFYAYCCDPIMIQKRIVVLSAVCLLLVSLEGWTRGVHAQSRLIAGDRPGDRMISEYFRQQTQRLAENCLADIRTIDDWNGNREEYRAQLLDMLGLQPMPERTNLDPVVTGTVDMGDWVVENIHFQSRPGLYVTANLYRPKVVEEKLPAILYVCGHGGVKKDGVSFGNKVHYHHHGAWFARNGYVCLTIDSLQLGEIEAIHHGTYRYDMWWWLNRGYTPAGVEAWNCVRALDYLETRPEVDPERFGVTGRSGGGAYSWWIAAIDDRIQCAVPVAGVTDLTNHVVDGCVEGHCDCMFFVNTYQWDYSLLAALVAPRPLLISNTDRDSIFPLDGVVRIHKKVRDIYALHNAEENLALHITAGPHQDTQELRIHAFRWFNHFLKDDDSLIDIAAEKFLEPEQLQVFRDTAGQERLPSDRLNENIHESFVARELAAELPTNVDDWTETSQALHQHLETQVFRAWKQQAQTSPPVIAFDVTRDQVRLRAYDFIVQDSITLRLYLATRVGDAPLDLVVLNAFDDQAWNDFVATYATRFADVFPLASEVQPNAEGFRSTSEFLNRFPWGMAYIAPRGIGRTKWDENERKRTQIERRFYLLGQSLDGMRIYDLIEAADSLRSLEVFGEAQLWLQSQGQMAANTVYASLFIDDVERMDLHQLATDHREGPFLLNVTKRMNIPQAVTMAMERHRVVIYSDQPDDWHFARGIQQLLELPGDQFQIRDALPINEGR